MTRFFQPSDSPVELTNRTSKWDRCTIVSTGKEYRPQGASGRTAVLRLVTEGMTVEDLVKKAATYGFSADFTRGAIIKHHDSGTGAWKLEGYDGLTIEKLKKIRTMADPEKEAARQAKKQAAAEERARKKAEREEKRDLKNAERRLKRQAAKEAKEAAAAAAAAAAQSGEGESAEADTSEEEVPAKKSKKRSAKAA